MQNKRYYWLKLHEHFFDRAVIKYLRKLPDGDTIVLIYLELLCISLSSEGFVYTDGLYPSIEEDIALMLGEELMTVKLALSALEAAKLITRGGEEDDYFMQEYPEMVGSETASTRRSRALREKRKQKNVALQHDRNADAAGGNALATNCNTEKEIEIDKEKESDKETEDTAAPKACGMYQNVFLTDPELQSLKERFPDSFKGKIDNLSAYLKSTGKKYKNHYLTICRWDARDKKETKQEKRTGFPDYSDIEEGESY